MLILLAQAPNMIDIQSQALTISPVGTVGMLVQLAAGAILVIGALAVLYFLLRGGLGWILAGGEKGKVEEARGMITNAIIGMVILASVFALFGVLLDFFGLRSRINIGNYGGSPGGAAAPGGNTGGTGGTPICTLGASADDGGAGHYCTLNGQSSSARVICTATAGIPYLHWEPCSCISGTSTGFTPTCTATAPAGGNTGGANTTGGQCQVGTTMVSTSTPFDCGTSQAGVKLGAVMGCVTPRNGISTNHYEPCGCQPDPATGAAIKSLAATITHFCYFAQ